MKKLLKRIRGAVGLGLTWAAAWFGAGVILLSAALVIELVVGTPAVGRGLVAVFAGSVLIAVAGFIGGVIFSGVLGIAEGRHRFDEMSLPRFAAWGAVGGLLLSGLLLSSSWPLAFVDVVIAGVVTLLSAGSAAGSLALARRADDQELLESGEDVADIGLTEQETQQLLGKMRPG